MDADIPRSQAEADAAAGAAIYTRAFLAIYDPLVTHFSSRFIWKCPSRLQVAFYNENVSARHLDVGVGTGYFLDKCRFPSATPTIGLMDLNPNSLAVTARRIRRYHPLTFKANVLEPLQINAPQFDSIGLNYLLHCLPGDLHSKGVVFRNLKPLLNEGGVIFGTTILGVDARHGWLARHLIPRYNAMKTFTNAQDSSDDLEQTLRTEFRTYSLRVVGSVALFVGRV